MFTMHLSSNQTVPNLGRVASILMILVPVLQWTQKNRPRVLRISFTSSLFIMKFMVDWISSRIHHGLTTFTNPWVSFPLLRNECLSVPPRMRLFLLLVLASIVSGLLIVSSTSSKNSSKPFTLLWVSSATKLIWIWTSSTA